MVFRISTYEYVLSQKIAETFLLVFSTKRHLKIVKTIIIITESNDWILR
jgi:hypothetical protein